MTQYNRERQIQNAYSSCFYTHTHIIHYLNTLFTSETALKKRRRIEKKKNSRVRRKYKNTSKERKIKSKGECCYDFIHCNTK